MTVFQIPQSDIFDSTSFNLSNRSSGRNNPTKATHQTGPSSSFAFVMYRVHRLPYLSRFRSPRRLNFMLGFLVASLALWMSQLGSCSTRTSSTRRTMMFMLPSIPETDVDLSEHIRLLSLASERRPCSTHSTKPPHQPLDGTTHPPSPLSRLHRARALRVLGKWFLRIARRTSLREVFATLALFQRVAPQGALRLEPVFCEEYGVDDEPIGSPPPLSTST